MAVIYCPPLFIIACSSQRTNTHKYLPAILSEKEKISEAEKFPFRIREKVILGVKYQYQSSSELILWLISLSVGPHLKASSKWYVLILVYGQ